MSADCLHCGAANPPGGRFCAACGAQLTATSVPAAPRDNLRPTRGRIEGERKQVTVMFVDVVGSMDLAETLDPERWRALLERFFVIVSGAVHRVEGTVHQFTGDGVLALFGAPVAHEDHAQRACQAALELHEQLAAFGAELAAEGVGFAVRVGLNSGEVIVGEIGAEGQLDYTAIGHTMGMAQRMEALAPAGSTALSATTARLVGDEFALRDMGAFEVKGSSVPRQVFELVGRLTSRDPLSAASARAEHSPFVGREDENATLEAALQRALSGDGRVVGVVGDPGVGKSRLAHEFARRCERDGVTVHAVRALAHGRGIPLMPALELMRVALGVREGDQPADARAQIAGRLGRLDASFANDLPLLFDFLGIPDPGRPPPKLDPDARQRALLSLVRRFVRARSEHEPAVMVIEDLHWLDDASAQFLAELVRASARTRTLLVLTYRPEYRGEILRGSHCQQLALRPLSQPSVARLLASLLGEDPSLDGLPELVAARAAGNPFFCEELISGLVEDGHLIGEPGAHRLVRTVETIVLPASVQATLAARIDRLGEREKELLQRAAVIGFELSEPLLRATSGLQRAQLKQLLGALVSAGLLVDRANQPGVEYVFKHPLTQEVAYRAQLSARRRQLHGEVARAIEQLYPDRLDERAALVAHHWEAAGEPLVAAQWNARAAAWIGLSDMTQAVAHWRKVAELADPIPDSREAETLARLAHVRQLDYGWRLGMSDQEARLHYERARQILARREGDPRLVGLTSLYATVRGLAGHILDYEELSEKAYREAKAIGDPTLRMGTLIVIMQARLSRGRVPDALAVAEEAIELGAGNPTLASRESSVVCPYAWCLMFRGWILCDAGRPEDAADSLARALEAAGRHDDLETEGWAHMLHVLVARHSGQLETMLAHAMEAYEIGERTGAAFSRAWQSYFLGCARLMAGETNEAIISIERSIEIARDARTALEQEPIRFASLAEAYLQAGDHRRALQAARESVAIALARGNAGNLPYGYRVLAEVLLSGGHGDRAAARAALEQAEGAAHATGALAELPHIKRLRATLVPVS